VSDVEAGKDGKEGCAGNVCPESVGNGFWWEF